MSTQLIDARGHTLRHIHPTSRFPSEGGTATILNRTYGFTWIPLSHSPTSADLVEGSYTSRLGDSGEFTLTFPNGVGTLGLWRERFSEDLALEFIEVYRDDVLEFVGSIQRIEIDRGVVTISGPDAWGLLRRAYERDRSWTAAPQEVITNYTTVPVVTFADAFDDGSVGAGWTGTASVTLTEANGRMKVHTSTGAAAEGVSRTFGFTTQRWEVTAAFAEASGAAAEVGIALYDGSSNFLAGILVGDSRVLLTDLTTSQGFEETPSNVVQRMPMGLQLRRAGRWLYGYKNGRLIGALAYPTTAVATIRIIAVGNFGVGAGDVYLDEVAFTEHQPFLNRGTDVGSLALPGDYPTGGLHGRYYNATDLQTLGSAFRASVALSPARGDPFGDRLDAVIDTTASLSLPFPGMNSDYFFVRWFGAVYLRGDLGNYQFEVTTPVDGVRLWVGKTAWGDQLIDAWTTAPGTVGATRSMIPLGSAAAWYPIVLEYFCDTATPAIKLQFTPPSTTYTDPGGTSITGSVKRVIPSTSLSPLGCYDNRVQGTSHFDLVQQTAQTFGYQITLEPMQLESGEFPGRLVPRIRVGSDTDVVLEVEDDDHHEPILSPGVTLDASDQTIRLVGTGAGIADGKGGQSTAEVTDLALAGSGLFALETWVDAGDVAFPDLLAARLNAELALRETSWEEVRGTPRAQERLADTWPLSSTLAAMRWRPGDGVRLDLPEVGVVDAEPRQLLQVTRTFGAEGRTGTQVAFRQRPRSAGRSVRSLLRAALAPQRSYQRQKVTIPANYVEAVLTAGTFSGFSIVALYPGDHVTAATIRIPNNTAGTAISVEINGNDVTSALGGPWSTTPVEVDVTGYAIPASTSDNRLYTRVKNGGGVTTSLNFQLIVEVLR